MAAVHRKHLDDCAFVCRVLAGTRQSDGHAFLERT